MRCPVRPFTDWHSLINFKQSFSSQAFDVREKHLFANVAAERANAILAKLNRAQIKGHKVKIKAA
jgi:hypothetical protein